MRVYREIWPYWLIVAIGVAIGAAAVIALVLLLLLLPYDLSASIAGREGWISFRGGVAGWFGLVALMTIMFTAAYQRHR